MLKGAAARKGVPGDLIIITCFTTMDDTSLDEFKPAVVFVDEDNRMKEER